MITEKVYGKLSHTDKKIETVYIDWFERDKKILFIFGSIIYWPKGILSALLHIG